MDTKGVPTMILALTYCYWLDLAVLAVVLAVLAVVLTAYAAVRLGRLFRRLMRWIEEDESRRLVRRRQRLLAEYTAAHDERRELQQALQSGPADTAVRAAKSLKQTTATLQRHKQNLLRCE